jgi:membrane protein YqaA with SNARE-associated domain
MLTPMITFSLFQRRLVIVLLIISFLVGWSVVLYFIGPREIVDMIGAKGYLAMFLVSLFGGMSSIGGPAYVATIVTLAAGGLNPFLLGAASGAGITIGDTIYYYLGRRGSSLIHSNKAAEWLEKFSNWLLGLPRWLAATGIYIYTGFTPLPNDILTISIGLARFPYVPAIIALTLGNFTLTTLIALGSTVAFGQ